MKFQHLRAAAVVTAGVLTVAALAGCSSGGGATAGSGGKSVVGETGPSALTPVQGCPQVIHRG